jgi:hypothetical protein
MGLVQLHKLNKSAVKKVSVKSNVQLQQSAAKPEVILYVCHFHFQLLVDEAKNAGVGVKISML